jgi:hypothetical protein
MIAFIVGLVIGALGMFFVLKGGYKEVGGK